MSRYATAAYINCAEDHQLDQKLISLVRIDLVVPTTRSLFLSTHEYKTPDGQMWDGILDDLGPIEARSSLLSEGPDLAVCPIRIARRKVSFQTDNTQTVLDLLNQYDWQGASVKVYTGWESLPAFSDWLIEFVGSVTSYVADANGISLSCKQGTSWAAMFPDLIINSTTFPGHPDSVTGRVLPVNIGDRRAEQLRYRSPFQVGYDDAHTRHEQVGGATLVDSGIVVDTGRYSGRLVVAFSSHQLAAFGQRYSGANLFMRGGDFLAEVDPSALIIENDVKGARITVATNQLLARTGVVPPDINHARENPAGAISVCDIFSTDTYAEMTNTAPNRQIELVIATPTVLGTKQQPTFFNIAYSTVAGSAPLRVFARVPDSGLEGPRVTLPATAGLEYVAALLGEYWQGSAAANDDWYSIFGDIWNFGGGQNSAHPLIDLVLDFAYSNAANRARVFWGGLTVTYRPNRAVINPGYSPGRTGGIDVAGRRRTGQPRPGEVFYGGRQIAPIGSVLEVQSDFFHNWQGWADDGSGSYTGVASALISKACDVAQFLLRKYGLVSSALIETGAAVVGSFVDARSGHRTIEGNPATVARSVNESTRVSDAVAAVARETAAICLISRRTGKYNWIPWDQDAPTGYDRTLEAVDLLDNTFEAERQTESDIVNAIRVRYGFDAFRGSNLHSAFVAPNVSGGGYSASGRRDQTLTLVASASDRLDFNVGGGNLAALLTAADYSGSSLMQHVRTQMKAVGGSTDILVQWGFEVVAAYNDVLTVKVGGTTYTVTITAASYRTGTALASETQALLNAAGTGLTFTVTWNADCTFTIAASGAFILDWTRGGATANKLAALLFGFDCSADSSSAATQIGVIGCYGETFRLARAAGTLTLYPDSGTNKARSAWPLMGFDPLYDRPAVSETLTRIFTAFTRCGTRERQARASAGTGTGDGHGARPELGIDSQWLNSTQMAINLRDRVFDWRVEQPVRLKFGTRRMPDIDRGMIFPLGATLDSVKPYPSYGSGASWSGRRALCLEVRRDVGAKGMQEIVAVEVARVGRDASSVAPGSPYGIPGSVNAVGVDETIMWQDVRSLQNFLYVQSLDINGASMLPANGVQLSTTQLQSQTASDYVAAIADSGFFYTVWIDGAVTIRAQKFDSLGGKYWGPDGKIVRIGTAAISNARLCSDSLGGIIVCWEDSASGTIDIRAQRVLADATLAWTSTGVVICSATGDQTHPDICSDGSSGAIICWDDLRGANKDIYAQKIRADGTVAWTANGVAVCTATAEQKLPKICTDAAGGAIITWIDLRDSATIQHPWVARIKSDGTLPWTADGVKLPNIPSTTGLVGAVSICANGLGGAYVANHWYRNDFQLFQDWNMVSGAGVVRITPYNYNSGSNGPNTTPGDYSDPPIMVVNSSYMFKTTLQGLNSPYIYKNLFVARFTHSGNPGAAQSYTIRNGELGGPQVTGLVSNPSMTLDANNEPVLAWEDTRDGIINVYAQKVLTLTGLAWTVNGVRVTDVASQRRPIALATIPNPDLAQQLLVDNNNKWIDLHDTADSSVQITTGTYAAAALAEQAQRAMNNASLDGPGSSTYYYRAGWGTYVRAGHNDKLATAVNVTGSYESDRTTTITPGDWTPEQLCSVLAAGLSATWSDKGVTFTVLYNSTNGTFEIRASALFRVGARTGDSIWSTLGGNVLQTESPATAFVGYWSLNFATASSPVASRHYHRFWMRSSYATNVWEWSTGTHSASNIGATMGYNTAADSAAAGDIEAPNRVG